MEGDKKESNSDSILGILARKMKNKMGIGSPERNAMDTYEHGMPIVPECVSVKEGEIPIKQYNVAVLKNLFKFERAEGRMQVTNKRVIFRAAGRSIGGRTTMQHEFDINEIGGIKANNNFRFSFFYLIIALLIIDFTGSAINGRMPSIPKLVSLLPANGGSAVSIVLDEFIDSNNARISGILLPSHLRGASVNETAAAIIPGEEPEELIAAMEAVQIAREEEESAKGEVDQGGVMRTRRVATDDWDWNTGEQIYVTQSFRDTSASGLVAAQELLAAASAAREEAEEIEAEIREKIEAAMREANEANKGSESPDKTWALYMTILGVALGICGLIPFFVLFKKFGLKLIILYISIFGWSLALAASGSGFLYVLLFISIAAMIFCIYLFCSKPNLAIIIKTKNGAGVALNICRDAIFTAQEEKGSGFAEVIPTNETENAISEIAAIISDIQKSGDSGVNKWVKK